LMLLILMYCRFLANLSPNAVEVAMEMKHNCISLRVAFCHRHRVQYSYTSLPNKLDQSNQDYINMQLAEYDALISVKCYNLLPLFLCSLYAPKCNTSFHVIKPCKSLCKEAVRRCEFFLAVFSLQWPFEFNCDHFEDDSDADICVGFRENQLLQRKAQ
ncbi:Fz domain containing protein-like protein, partial [Leptotrombidium deliense]